MTFYVELTESARKELKKLDPYTQKIILLWLNKNLEGCEDPRLYGKPLSANRAGQWRYRIGIYHLLCKNEDNKLIVLGINAGLRKEIWK